MLELTTRFAWRPQFNLPFETPWGKREKFCYLNGYTRRQFAAAMNLLYPELTLRQAVQKALNEHLSSPGYINTGKQMALKMRLCHKKTHRPFHQLVRYCPRCIKAGYHSFFHQLNGATHCFIDGAELLSAEHGYNESMYVYRTGEPYDFCQEMSTASIYQNSTAIAEAALHRLSSCRDILSVCGLNFFIKNGRLEFRRPADTETAFEILMRDAPCVSNKYILLANFPRNELVGQTDSTLKAMLGFIPPGLRTAVQAPKGGKCPLWLFRLFPQMVLKLLVSASSNGAPLAQETIDILLSGKIDRFILERLCSNVVCEHFSKPCPNQASWICKTFADMHEATSLPGLRGGLSALCLPILIALGQSLIAILNEGASVHFYENVPLRYMLVCRQDGYELYRELV